MRQSGGSKAPTQSKLAKNKAKVKASKYKIDGISKQNFDVSHTKQNISEISELPLKYVLKCTEGLYKNRFIFITTHPEGQILGAGEVKLHGLTLQIEGVGLAERHAQLRYDGFKSFKVVDFGSESGTWMNIPAQGILIQDGEKFAIGPHFVSFTHAEPLDEIEQICMLHNVVHLSDLLKYNSITTLPHLYAAVYNDFQGYPFEKKDIERFKRICEESKTWYEEGKKYSRLNINYLNEPLRDLSIEIGWQSYFVSNDPQMIFSSKNPAAEVSKGRLIPHGRVFSKIQEGKQQMLSLHAQIKIGNLSFEMTRFNSGVGEDQGFRPSMEDGLVVEEDIGGSEWKLISLFAIFDGHGGQQCMQYMRDNIVSKVREWTKLLDAAGDLNEMVKVLMSKTFFELDYQFYRAYPQLGLTCGATALCLLVVESRVYSFHVGDCKSFLFRSEVLYKMSLEHLPSRGDERNRIQAAGGFIQYDRLMGKCTLSRCLGQFEYKSVEDYENQMKGKMKSYLSCIPDMTCFDIQVHTDQFILISTDGIFFSMDPAQVTDFIRERYNKLQLEENPNKIISGIMENCKILSNDCDNMAAILLIIKKGELQK